MLVDCLISWALPTDPATLLPMGLFVLLWLLIAAGLGMGRGVVSRNPRVFVTSVMILRHGCWLYPFFFATGDEAALWAGLTAILANFLMVFIVRLHAQCTL